jgi:hypothetical protein
MEQFFAFVNGRSNGRLAPIPTVGAPVIGGPNPSIQDLRLSDGLHLTFTGTGIAELKNLCLSEQSASK